jgi:hypothetical protein
MDILARLRTERDKAMRQVNALSTAIRALSGLNASTWRAAPGRIRRRISARGLDNIRAAQRARWAKARGKQNLVSVAKAHKRTMSAAARRKIAASQRTRWAKIRAAKK